MVSKVTYQVENVFSRLTLNIKEGLTSKGPPTGGTSGGPIDEVYAYKYKCMEECNKPRLGPYVHS